MNDTGLVIPYAIKAGLGEYARNQMVITPEFGPRVRFSKIFTNAPFHNDAPRQLVSVRIVTIAPSVRTRAYSPRPCHTDRQRCAPTFQPFVA